VCKREWCAGSNQQESNHGIEHLRERWISNNCNDNSVWGVRVRVGSSPPPTQPHNEQSVDHEIFGNVLFPTSIYWIVRNLKEGVVVLIFPN